MLCMEIEIDDMENKYQNKEEKFSNFHSNINAINNYRQEQ